MYRISFYAPVDHVETIKNAMFKAGAGKLGDYDCCCWQTLGEGQFMPLSGSKPFVGSAFKLEKVEEYKVEMICQEAIILDAIAALRASHPYEEPAYQVIRLEDF